MTVAGETTHQPPRMKKTDAKAYWMDFTLMASPPQAWRDATPGCLS